MQKVRLPADEPAAQADPEAETAALLRQHRASTDVPTSRGQVALDTADRYAGNAHAYATKRAYRSDWTHFGDWCRVHGFIAMPAEPRTIGAYFASLGHPGAVAGVQQPAGVHHGFALSTCCRPPRL